jgi:hypothetical protein
MNLDIRTPIGYFFAIIGAVLFVFGLIPNAEMYARHSLGININLLWGVVLLVFGGVMLAMSWRAGRADRGSAPPTKSA